MPFGLAEQKGGLLALSAGNPVDPNWIEWYIDQGYAERVDEETGAPAGNESPRAVLKITAAGWVFMQGKHP